VAGELLDELSDAEIKQQLLIKRDRLRESLAKVEQALEAYENPARRHKMGPEARENISEAQRKRWAAWRKEHKK
jgi:predicted DNA-binding protein YlxM (UPF0122 family)